MITSATTTRVEEHTDADINEEIYNRTKNNVLLYASAGPSAIDRRLRELEMEWDIERVLEANAASFSLMGLTLGAFIDRRWFIFPAAVAGFLLQHAIQGWCPPVPLFRRMGIRTAHEIQQERHALKALRGDYRDVAEFKAEVNGADALQVTRAFEAAGNNSSS
nr:hypothetical protein [Candidatus Nitrospira allomarina]